MRVLRPSFRQRTADGPGLAGVAVLAVALAALAAAAPGVAGTASGLAALPSPATVSGAGVRATPTGSCAGVCAETTSPTSENWMPYTLNHTGSPGGRDAPAVAYDARDGYLLLFGGCSRHQCPLGDTWKYQGGVWVNLTSVLPLAPPPRYGAVMTYDARDRVIVLTGGVGPSGPLSDTWQFAAGAWSPVTSSPSPPARSFAMGAYDPALGAVLLFGGNSTLPAPMGDTWTYENGTWTPVNTSAAPAPAARAAGTLSFDPEDGSAILFGGTGACGLYCNDTWTFSEGGWTNLTSAVGPAPPARSGANMGVDAGLDEVVLFGGQNAAVLADTWAFHGGRWTDLTLNLSRTPPARDGAGGDYDAHDGYYVIYGGQDGTLLRTGTWVLLSPLSTAVSTAATRVAPGASDRFTAAAAGGLAPYAFVWTFGDGSPAANGTLAAHTYAAVGSYLVTLSVTDSLAVQASVQLAVSVAYPPVTVGLTPSLPAPHVGQSITFAASAQGGQPPYTYLWGGSTGTCHGAGPTLSCLATTAGTLSVSVTATDAGGRAASAAVSLTVLGASGANATPPAASPVTTSPAVAPGAANPALLVLPALAAIGVAAAIGYATFRTARRRAPPPPPTRPLCYAVPLWSETPEEFRPEDEFRSPPG